MPSLREKIEVKFGKVFSTVLLLRKTCKECDREFLIVNNQTMTEAEYNKLGKS